MQKDVPGRAYRMISLFCSLCLLRTKNPWYTCQRNLLKSAHSQGLTIVKLLLLDEPLLPPLLQCLLWQRGWARRSPALPLGHPVFIPGDISGTVWAGWLGDVGREG